MIGECCKEKLEAIGISETERNIANKISRGGFTAVFFCPMSFSNWLSHPPTGVGIVVLAMLFFGALNNEANQSERADTQSQQQSAKALEGRPPAALPFVVSQQAAIADPSAQRKERREEQDLEAQQDMARWALIMIFITGAGVTVTAAGVIYVKQTLKATRDAVSAANRTADEARRIGEAQVRAYMCASYANLQVLADKSVSLTIIVRNSGQSPARKPSATIWFGIAAMFSSQATTVEEAERELRARIESGGLKIEQEIVSMSLSRFLSDMSAGEERTIEFLKISLTQDQIQAATEKPVQLRVDIRMKYTDVFGNSWEDVSGFTHLAKPGQYLPVGPLPGNW